MDHKPVCASDLSRMRPPKNEDLPKTNGSSAPTSDEPDEYVYFIQCLHTGRVKIGHSVRPRRRFGEINSHSPTQLAMIGTIAGDRQREKEIHGQLMNSQLCGEWFAPSAEVRDFLAEHNASLKQFSHAGEDPFEVFRDRPQVAGEQKPASFGR